MSRLLVAAAVAVTGIVALPRESTPDVTGAPSLVRPVPHRASRSARRHPLPHPRRRRHLTAVTPTPTATPAPVTTAAHDWTGVAQCESGGNWSIDTGNGFYGGLQFTLTTWHAFGGVGMPNDATEAEQITVAERVLAVQGVGAWPICGRYLRGAA